MEIHLQQLVAYQSKVMEVEAIVANDRARTESERMDGALITRVASLGTLASMPLTPVLSWQLHRRSADIVHLHTPNPGAAFALLSSLRSSKLVITHHSDTLGRPLLRKIVSPFIDEAMKRASRIIVTSTNYRHTSEELAPYRDKCVVIPLGIDPTRFLRIDPVAIAQITHTYGPRIVLAVGRLVAYKGFEHLIQSMRTIDATLLLIGNGPLKATLKSQILELGIQSKVHLLDDIEDASIPAFYQAASIFVIPSITRAEAFGIVQLEAMASGLPVINTSIPSGAPEVSLHDQTGLTVPPGDTEALSNAIRQLLGNHEMRNRFGKAACIRLHKEFTTEQMSRRTVELYHLILAEDAS